MDKKRFVEAIQALKALPKRKFKQRYDLVINLRGLNLKKPEEQVDLFIQLPNDTGKKARIGALVGPELAEQAKTCCDVVIVQDDFAKHADKKAVKKLANSADFFIAQANLMVDVAKNFGRVFGPRGKMPNPKAGCVVPPNANLKTVADKLRKTVRLAAKEQASIKTMVGTEDMADEQVAGNMQAVYSNLIGALPQEAFNVKNVLLKFTMSRPVKITDKGVELRAEKVEPPKKAPKKAAKKKAPKEEPKEEAQEATPETPPEEPEAAA